MSLKAIHENIDDIPEQYQSLYTERDGKWELTGVEGIKTVEDVKRVQVSLDKERSEHRKTKEGLSVWKDLNYEETVTKLDRIDELEAANSGKIDESKMEELVEKRVKTRLGPVERENKILKEKLTGAETTIEDFKSKDVKRTVGDQILKAATDSKILTTALEDVKMLASSVFELDEEGNAKTKDNVGVTPGISPDVWLTEMEDKRPHWWPVSKGGGAHQVKDGGAFSKNPWSPEHWNITEQGKLITSLGEAKAEEFAKAANSKIGAIEPTEKK